LSENSNDQSARRYPEVKNRSSARAVNLPNGRGHRPVLAIELSDAPIMSASCWRARAEHSEGWRESLYLARFIAFQSRFGGAVGGTDLARRKSRNSPFALPPCNDEHRSICICFS
jgi:hypothetical protein